MNYDEKIEVVQNNLYYIRTSLNLSAREFGEYIGLTRQTINNIERGRNKLSKVQYLAILYVIDKIIKPKLKEDNMEELCDTMDLLVSVKVIETNYTKSLCFKR